MSHTRLEYQAQAAKPAKGASAPGRIFLARFAMPMLRVFHMWRDHLRHAYVILLALPHVKYAQPLPGKRERDHGPLAFGPTLGALGVFVFKFLPSYAVTSLGWHPSPHDILN